MPLLSRLGSWLGSVWPVATLAVASVVVVGVTGCGPCSGDDVYVDGVCVLRCEDATCGDGLACVHSVCRPECKRDSDCEGEDICESILTDEGKSGKYCFGLAVTPSPYASEPGPSEDTTDEVSTSDQVSSNGCKESSDCAQNVPRVCVDDECRTVCTLHEHCGRAGSCTGSTEDDGATVNYCQADDFPRAEGQFGSQCLAGTSSCDTASGFQCIGAGDGDVDSYCTLRGCEDENDCPSGYFCSENRVGSRAPCEATCGLVASPEDPNCVPSADIGAGKPYRCADGGGLLLTLCLERSFCAPCESDADCRGEPNQVCALGPDQVKMCTVLCAPGQDSCPWGAATECAVFDENLGVPTCGHRFQACKGTGKSCEPCIHDGDCPNGFCARSDFSGEQFCYDAEVSCACGEGEDICVGGGCPDTPGGEPMNCVSAGDNAPPSVCYGAQLDEAEGTPLGCW